MIKEASKEVFLIRGMSFLLVYIQTKIDLAMNVMFIRILGPTKLQNKVLRCVPKITVFCVSGFLEKIYMTNLCCCGCDGNVLLSDSKLGKP